MQRLWWRSGRRDPERGDRFGLVRQIAGSVVQIFGFFWYIIAISDILRMKTVVYTGRGNMVSRETYCCENRALC
jgi:hypothetical protein